MPNPLGLSGEPILAHQGDTVLLVDLEGNVLEQGGAAELNGQSIYWNHILLFSGA